MSKGPSPTTRSIEYFRNRGCIVTKVEQVLPMPGRPFPRRKDAFGFGDLLVAAPGLMSIFTNRGRGDGWIALIQVTSTGAFNAHVEKIRGYTSDKRDPKNEEKARECNLNAHAWLDAGGRIFVHGWALRGPRGQVKRWTLRKGEMVDDPELGLVCREDDERQNRTAATRHVRRDRTSSRHPRRRSQVRKSNPR